VCLHSKGCTSSRMLCVPPPSGITLLHGRHVLPCTPSLSYPTWAHVALACGCPAWWGACMALVRAHGVARGGMLLRGLHVLCPGRAERRHTQGVEGPSLQRGVCAVCVSYFECVPMVCDCMECASASITCMWPPPVPTTYTPPTPTRPCGVCWGWVQAPLAAPLCFGGHGARLAASGRHWLAGGREQCAAAWGCCRLPPSSGDCSRHPFSQGSPGTACGTQAGGGGCCGWALPCGCGCSWGMRWRRVLQFSAAGRSNTAPDGQGCGSQLQVRCGCYHCARGMRAMGWGGLQVGAGGAAPCGCRCQCSVQLVAEAAAMFLLASIASSGCGVCCCTVLYGVGLAGRQGRHNQLAGCLRAWRRAAVWHWLRPTLPCRCMLVGSRIAVYFYRSV
jgi:hypothetical protein